VPGIGARGVDVDVFRAVSSALFERRRLRVGYHARAGDAHSERVISPQRLVYYRNNWYLDAWCHMRRGLRSFSLDRMRVLDAPEEAAREVDARELDAAVLGSYGIYAGKARHLARIRFGAAAAAWVAAEQWHPKQRGRWSGDAYLLEIPYDNAEELVMDILRHGGDAEVLAPPELRAEVRRRLRRAVGVYG
ncbi:MAG: WYL domain-containing protein, partial [Gammaproteobacteria bacterium]